MFVLIRDRRSKISVDDSTKGSSHTGIYFFGSTLYSFVKNMNSIRAPLSNREQRMNVWRSSTVYVVTNTSFLD